MASGEIVEINPQSQEFMVEEKVNMVKRKFSTPIIRLSVILAALCGPIFAFAFPSRCPDPIPSTLDQNDCLSCHDSATFAYNDACGIIGGTPTPTPTPTPDPTPTPTPTPDPTPTPTPTPDPTPTPTPTPDPTPTPTPTPEPTPTPTPNPKPWSTGWWLQWQGWWHGWWTNDRGNNWDSNH